MARYRDELPQLTGGIFLSDSGIETTLIFKDGLELPYFAAFHLLKDEKGYEALRRYFQRHVAIARNAGFGFVLESPTWRASADWGQKLGYSPADLAAANKASIRLLADIRNEFDGIPMVISGCVGPRGDGYDPGVVMSPEAAESYHASQIDVFAGTEADMITAITMTNANEAIGVARAAQKAQMPSAISFTVETDGRLPTGQTLKDAIEEVDAKTDRAPAYYMINCAHPSHFSDALDGGAWTSRLRGLRPNASRCSHAELNEAEELDEGNPRELGHEIAALATRFPNLTVFGGCCGTDHRHVEQMARACGAPQHAR